VTEQRSTDQRLHDVERRVQAQVETALRQRDEFLTVAAHELKTPIASLKGFAQLELRRLQRASPPDRERIRRALDTIKSQADRLTRLVNGLLDVERLASGRLVLEPGLLDLTTLVRSAAIAFAAASTRHTVQLHLAEALLIRADAVRIEQVLTSLLDNAVKFSPGGGAVEVSLAPRMPHAVQLAVRDHGPGILPERRAGIFERFAPTQPATSARHDGPESAAQGMGLSLHVSRQIVELHGGTIVAEFPPDGGARFVVTLPLADPLDA
jgi:signal transduction histidine kinase